MSNHEGPRYPDREFDLLARAENQLDSMSSELQHLDDNGHLLYGILCAAVSITRQLYNATPTPPPLRTKGPDAERALDLQDLWDWANSYRLVVYGSPGGVVYSDVHLIGIRPHTIGRDRIQIAPGVYILGPGVSA